MNENVSKLARIVTDHAVCFQAGDRRHDAQWMPPTAWKAEAK